MNSKTRHISVVLPAAFVVIAIMVSGCTGNYLPGADTGTNPETKTAVYPPGEETSKSPVTKDASDMSAEILPEPVMLPGSITEDTAVIPKYDPETKEKLLNEARAEILRVFPGADASSLGNYHWGTERAGAFFVPVIIFENVITDIKRPDNLCQKIYYDSKKGRVVHWHYSPDSPVRDISSGEKIRHEDVDIERDILPVFRKMVGDEEYEQNKDNYFIYLVDSGNFPLTTVAFICEGSGGAKSYMGEARLYFNRGCGEISVYGERFNDEEFFEKSVSSSSVPEVSLEEAKSILESKIEELYPGEPQNIEYAKGERADLSGGLFRLDSSTYMNIDNGSLLSPAPLAWGIVYITEETRGWGGSGEIWAAVDAHSGEILHFYNDRIRISGKSYE